MIETTDAGLDIMTLRVEHEHDVSAEVANAIKTQCEVTVAVEVLSPNTLDKTEFKAKRITDNRKKT